MTDSKAGHAEAAYPDMKRRYLSSVIDLLLVLGLCVVVAAVFQSPGVIGMRVFLIGLLIVNYEPVLISKRQTVGQWLMRIRVRQHDDPTRRIGLIRAYVRTLLKLLLGTLSFFTMGFNKERRALHDLATGSVVLRY